jgi:hypothetical protein
MHTACFAPQPSLKEFISREIASITKGLQAQVSSLQNRLQAKKKNLGTNKPSTWTTNKKGSRNPVSLSNKATVPADTPTATADTRGSTNDNRKPGKKKQKPRKNGSRNNKPSWAWKLTVPSSPFTDSLLIQTKLIAIIYHSS